ncbi:hypothetical protein A9Q84_00600 [Halobacteriovorax marinus]|uniref:DUF1330 domain-containing protein n=1 Tax=Halobacteriovorax marinus TaxID=97084 RepID=A0A1Y5FBG3_9BACT|nr:hypothetical protein A9Q84_00600 [Halobacteriovorax marinus]
MSKATLVVSGTVKNPDKVTQYKEVAIEVLKRHGAILPPLAREVTKILAGRQNPKSLLEIEFPNEQNILDAFNDPEYLAVVGLRDEGFEDLSIYIAASED